MSAAVDSPAIRTNEPEREVDGGEDLAPPSIRGLAGGLVTAVARPRALARETLHLGRDFARILAGTDEFRTDGERQALHRRRLAHLPGYRRIAQDYTAWTAAMTRLVDPYEAAGADWRDVERARFTLTALTSALAPTNTLLGNPAALKRAIDTGGRSLLRGIGKAVRGRPEQRRDAHPDRPVGLRRRPQPRHHQGPVVYRDDVIELIQYYPTTPRVRERPLIIVPPPIGRYYFLDLRPGRNFVEHALGEGLQVFMISWRNPTRKQAALEPLHLRGAGAAGHRRGPGDHRVPRT